MDLAQQRDNPTMTPASITHMYRVMNSIETNLGGGEGIEGLYGSIKGSGMQKILDCMRDLCGMDGNSHIVDIGAGLGRPLVHALITGHVAEASGIELDRVKCQKAASFFKLAFAQLQNKGLTNRAFETPKFVCAPIEVIDTLNPATHAYSFWEGVPFEARSAFGRLFAASKTLKAVTVVQRSMRQNDAAELMQELYNFGDLELVSSFPVSMSGSGRNFMAYVFNKVSLNKQFPSVSPPLTTQVSTDEEVPRVCTPPKTVDANVAAEDPTLENGSPALNLRKRRREVVAFSAKGGVGLGKKVVKVEHRQINAANKTTKHVNELQTRAARNRGLAS